MDNKYNSPSIKITQLTLSNFRNYKNIKIKVFKSPIIFIGDNGSGKTNILEAISFLAPGRGLRSVKYEEANNNNGNEGWAINAKVECNKNKTNFGIGTGTVEKKTNKNGRVVKVDNQIKPVSFLSSIISIIWITPQMDNLFVADASKRRKFFDRLVFNFEPNHIKQLNIYEKSLRERSKILKEKITNNRWLDVVEKSLANSGVAICAARNEYINILNEKLVSVLGPFPPAEVKIEGTVEGWLKKMPFDIVEMKFLEEIKKSRYIDSQSGRTKLGPHRSDFITIYKRKSLIAQKCSTGEQKSLLIGVILGQIRMLLDKNGVPPILLFDDIAAHLDDSHLKGLFSELEDINAQLWVTTTDTSLLKGMISNYQLMQVADDNIHTV